VGTGVLRSGCETLLASSGLGKCGRTLIGKLLARNQQAVLNYFAPVPGRVDDLLRKVQAEMFKVGCPMKVRHNEVASGQHEMSPIFCYSSQSADSNVFFMEMCNREAAKIGIQVLFREKPFAGINGSGMHANWSVENRYWHQLLLSWQDRLRKESFRH